MQDFLVIMDIPAIKKYVFATYKLKEIQGASIIVDQLNRRGFEEKLTEHIPANKVAKIYANGGSAQFVVTEVDTGSLEAALEKVNEHVTRKTSGMSSLVWGISPIKENFQAAMYEAQINLTLRRDQADQPVSSMHTSFSKECQSCSRLPAVTVEKDGDWLCSACHTKRDSRDQRIGIWQEFNEFLHNEQYIQNGEQIERPNDFSEIGQACNKKYMGIVYADGNAIGRLIREIDTKERFKDFAEIIDSSIKQACFRALARVFHHFLVAGEVIPADLLLLGGDDLLVALPADKALAFASLVSSNFEAMTKARFHQTEDPFFRDKLSQKGCTISLGVAVGKAHHPFRVLLSQSEDLLQAAKMAGSCDPDGHDFWVPSYIDFHQSAQSHQLNVAHTREINYSFKSQTEAGELNFSRTFRPYKVAELGKLYKAAHELKHLNFPSTKLNALYRAALQNRSQAMLETIRVISNCKPEERAAFNTILEWYGCRQCMPWSADNRTFLTELVEFYDLLDATSVIDLPGQELGHDRLSS
jgi:hypothetical protein